ncbi:MAG TPA: hypothetical protein VER55_04890, partial [Ardenticatenaceae bacterium]|nr:hypothetical protein [Ardenticatenaceae bacterium]
MRWNRWLLASAVGGFIGSVVGALVGWVSFGAGFGVAVGLGVGLFQWRALRAMVPAADENARGSDGIIWVGSSVMAAVIPGWLLLFAVVLGGSNGGQPVEDAGAYVGGVAAAAMLFAGVPGAFCSLLAGAFQWRVLKGRLPAAASRSALSWIAATLVGWGLSWAVEGAAASLILTSTALERPMALVVFAAGLVALLGSWVPTAVTTGIILARLLPGTSTDTPVPAL